MFSFPLLPSFVPVWMFLSELLITKLCTIKSQKKKKKSPLAFIIRHFDISHCCLDTGLCHSESESCTNGTEYESLRDRCAGCDIKNESWAMYTWPERYIHHKFMKETTRKRENLEGTKIILLESAECPFSFLHTHTCQAPYRPESGGRKRGNFTALGLNHLSPCYFITLHQHWSAAPTWTPTTQHWGVQHL